jgi:SPOR domain
VSTDEPEEKPAEAAESPSEETAPEPEALVCASCAAPLDDDQTYCLECGSPTPKAPRLSRRRGVGAVALGLAVLGLGTGGLAWAVASDRGDSAGVTSTGSAAGPVPTTGVTTIDLTNVPTALPPVTGGTPSVPSVPSVPGSGSTDTETITSGTATLPPPATDTQTTASTAPLPGTDTGETTAATDTGTNSTTTNATTSDWPAGRTAWTAVLASARNRPEAAAVRDRAQQKGETAGILVSDDHSELKPGFFVVFSGVFSSRQKAIDQAARLKGSFAKAYARKITG